MIEPVRFEIDAPWECVAIVMTRRTGWRQWVLRLSMWLVVRSGHDVVMADALSGHAANIRWFGR